jgi:hypothetical protein
MGGFVQLSSILNSSRMKSYSSPMVEQCAVIGDIVASKRVENRLTLQRTLVAVLSRVNSECQDSLRQPFEPTIGDEFQGVFDSVGSATRATLLVRLLLWEEKPLEVRFGIGLGSFEVFDESGMHRSQDGPGWWAARDAIERAETAGRSTKLSAKSLTRLIKFEGSRSIMDREVASTNAFLECRDALVEGMNARQRRILTGALLGVSQREIATNEGISPSAVSQNLRRSGGLAVKQAQEMFELRVTWST